MATTQSAALQNHNNELVKCAFLLPWCPAGASPVLRRPNEGPLGRTKTGAEWRCAPHPPVQAPERCPAGGAVHAALPPASSWRSWVLPPRWSADPPHCPGPLSSGFTRLAVRPATSGPPHRAHQAPSTLR